MAWLSSRYDAADWGRGLKPQALMKDRCFGAWCDRRLGRPARPPQDYFSIPGHTRHWQERLQGKPAVPPLARYAIGEGALTRQGIGAIYKRLARAVIDEGLVKVEPGRKGTSSARSARIRCGWV
ncbi:MAG: hypothetical protein IPN84_17285 [Sphingomonadales bacterium]|nr:hypothetical protein [Sphingomonadales bacterium]